MTKAKVTAYQDEKTGGYFCKTVVLEEAVSDVRFLEHEMAVGHVVRALNDLGFRPFEVEVKEGVN